MPYRRAHWWLLALFPLILLAFWPGYFGHVRHARIAEHAHGLTATAWLVLLTVQSWSASARRFAWHRAAGLAVFVAVPLFAAGGLLGVQDMAVAAAEGSEFNIRFGASLAPDDLISIVALVGFAAAALATRRRVRRHAGWMLATALLVQPPMIARLLPLLPGFPWLAAPGFLPAYYVAHLIAALAAAGLAWTIGREGRPFAIVAALGVVQAVSLALLDGSAGWQAAFGTIAAVPPLLLALIGAGAALAALWLCWRHPLARRAPAVRVATLEGA